MRLVTLIQRAFDSTIANWPVLLIRIAGSVAMTFVVIAAVIPVVMFVVYSGTMTDIESVSTSAEMLQWLWSNAIAIAALIIVISLIVAVAIAIHSFITGGVAGVFLDADRRAPREGWTRSQLAAFSPDAWMSHALRTWWPVFIIYNVTWGIWFLILLLPLLVAIPLLIRVQENAALGAAGCFLIAVWLLATVFGSLLVHVWTELAILDCVREERRRYLAPLRIGFSILLNNLGRLIALVLLMILVMIAVSSISLGMQFGFELGTKIDRIAFLFIPVQILLSLVQTVISVLVSSWLMACFATIVNEPHLQLPQAPQSQPLA